MKMNMNLLPILRFSFIYAIFSATLTAQVLPNSNLANSKSQTIVSSQAVFDDICLGEAHKVVSDKLRKSKLIELAVNEVYLGRLGLNGSYRTVKTIGGLKCLLFFDWDDASNLKELTMQTQPQSVSSYDGLLNSTWRELTNLLTELYGKPLQSADYPASSKLQNDMSLSTHIWRHPSGGTVLLGTSKSTDGYMVVVRFTTEVVQPVIIKK